MAHFRSTLTLNAELSHYCSVFDYIPQATVLFDTERQILYSNRFFNNRYDIEIQSAEQLPELEERLVSFLEKNNLFEEHVINQQTVSFRRVVTLESEYVLTTLGPSISSNGNGLSTNSQDLFKPNSDWFKSIVTHAPEAILILDFEKKKYIEANPKAVRLFGYSKKELLQTQIGDLSPQKLADNTSAKDASIAKIQECIDHNKSVKFEWQIKTKNGDLVPCEIRVHRLPTTDGVFIRSSITDLSFEKKANSEIKARKEQFNKLFGSDVVSMVMYTSAGEIVEANSAFARMLGGTLKSYKGLDVKTLIHKSDVKSFSKTIANLMLGDSGQAALERRYVDAKGNILTCLTSAKSYENWNGNTYIIETFQDVSQERKAQADLMTSEHRFRSLFEKSLLGIILIQGTELKLISTNKSARRMLDIDEGSKRNQLKVLLAGIPGEQHVDFKTFIEKILRGANPVLQLSLTTSSGNNVVIQGGGYRLFGQKDDTVVVGFSDITRAAIRKQTLVSQTAQLNAFIQYNMIPAAMFDRNMNYVHVGDQWLEMYPTEHGKNIIGKNYYDVHPKVPMRWKLQHMKAMAGQTVSHSRDMHIRSNGQKEWFKWMAKPWYASDDEIGGIIVYAEIITDEVENELAAQKQEARYQGFFENSTLGWIEVDATKLVDYCRKSSPENFNERKAILYFQESHVVGINEQIKEIFGINGDSSDGFEPVRYIKENIHGFLWKMVRSFRQNDTMFEHELVIENHIGERRNLFVSVRLPENSDFGRIIFGVLDVTDFKTSVEALRESEERYRTMFESNRLGVVYTNYKKSIIRVNPAFIQMFGYSEEEMQNIDENDLLTPKYQKLNDAIMKDFSSGAKRFATIEKEYRRKNGKRLIASTSSNALFDGSGSHYGTVTIVDDITERKINERQIQKQNDELKKINRELDQFVYSAAHDLRAPIANVLGLVKLLKMEDLNPTADQYVDLQEKSLDKLDEFIRSIVDYSRNSRLDLLKNKIEFETYIREITNQYAYFDNAEHLTVSINIKQNTPFISDPNRLSIVMNNLVSNAVRYMDISKKKPYLKIRVVVNLREATIIVEDNGIGIEKEHLGAIFDLFYRANSASKGTGIGLYIVKEAVAKLRGKIDVSSDFGKGTTFALRLKNFAPVAKKKKKNS